MEAPPTAAATPPPEPSLANLATLTREITESQGVVDAKAGQRKAMIRALHESGQADYKQMAEAMGVTVQTVYRIAPLGKKK